MRTDSRIHIHLADLAVVADASQDRGLRLHCESHADVPAFEVMPAYAEARPLTAGYRQQAKRVAPEAQDAHAVIAASLGETM